MRRLIVSGAAWPLACAAALAQPATVSNTVATGDESIEEIQVTATRRPVNALDVSAALTLIPADTVRAQKLATDALAAQAGVFLQQTTPGQGAAIVRGLKGSEVLHLVDGMRLNNAIFRNAPTQYLALVSPASVERLEVLRGSQAALYGSDAVGGVVQVINRVPRFDQSSVAHRGTIALGMDTAELERSMQGLIEVGDRRRAALLSVNVLETGNRRTGEGVRIAPSGVTSESARAAVSWRASDSASWLLDLQYGRQPETPRVDELVPGFGQTEPSSAEFLFAPNQRLFAHLRHEKRGGWFDADWRADLGWQRIDDDRITRAFGEDVRRSEANASELFGLTTTASRDFVTGSAIVGLEYYADRVSSRRTEVDLSDGARRDVQSRFPDGSRMTQAALFGSYALDVSDAQSLSAGLRLSAIDVSLAATDFSPRSDLDFDDVSADLGWTLDLGDRLQLVANLGYGFRAPNVFDLGTLGERPGNRFNVPNAGLRSEKMTQFDVGIRRTGGRLRGEWVAWVLHYDDRLTSVLTGGQTATGRDIVQTQNRARARIWGVEATGEYRFSERSVARLTLNVTRGEQEDAAGIQTPADRIPPLNGRLSFTRQLGALGYLVPYLDFASRQTRLSARDVRDPRIDPAGTDGWVSANLRWELTPGERWHLSLAALNLFDRRYRSHGSGIDAPGRNLRLNLRYRW